MSAPCDTHSDQLQLSASDTEVEPSSFPDALRQYDEPRDTDDGYDFYSDTSFDSMSILSDSTYASIGDFASPIQDVDAGKVFLQLISE